MCMSIYLYIYIYIYIYIYTYTYICQCTIHLYYVYSHLLSSQVSLITHSIANTVKRVRIILATVLVSFFTYTHTMPIHTSFLLLYTHIMSIPTSLLHRSHTLVGQMLRTRWPLSNSASPNIKSTTASSNSC